MTRHNIRQTLSKQSLTALRQSAFAMLSGVLLLAGSSSGFKVVVGSDETNGALTVTQSDNFPITFKADGHVSDKMKVDIKLKETSLLSVKSEIRDGSISLKILSDDGNTVYTAHFDESAQERTRAFAAGICTVSVDAESASGTVTVSVID